VVVHNRRRGVTLFESIVVLAILVIAAAVVTPSLSTLSGNTPVNAAADTVRARMADASRRARDDGRPYKFAVKDGTGEFQIAPDSPEFWDGAVEGASPPSTGDGSQPPLVIKETLPQEIRFVTPGDAGQSGGGGAGGWSCLIVFQPDGTTLQDAEIAFGGQGSRPLVLRVRAATGAVTTATP